MTQPRRVVVVGTGTDIGKTHVTTSLLRYGHELGLRVLGYKPVATGVDPRCDDAEEHARGASSRVIAPSFAYKRPISPHLAAREENRPIDPGVIAIRAAELQAECDVLFVEGAGGLLSPLGDTTTNADLCLRLAPTRVLLVAGDRLGVLHDVRTTTMAAKALGVSIDAVVLSAPAVADASTGTNQAELERLGIARVAAVFPRAEAAQSMAPAALAWAALGLT
jgi:dethiobiotin synthetase